MINQFFHFRILLDYQFRTFVHPSALNPIDEVPIDTPEIEEIKKSHRVGQDKYRRAVIEHMLQCPFSKNN